MFKQETSLKTNRGEIEMQISIEQFQTECLKLVDGIQKHQSEITITKFGRPIVKLVPILGKQVEKSLFGYMKDSVSIHGNIITPIEEEWEGDPSPDKKPPGPASGEKESRLGSLSHRIMTTPYIT